MAAEQIELFTTPEDADVGTAPFRLFQLEVYNWGPFCGLHRAEFDPHGTAIIGPTGSGKTTLVDALMTLLVTQPKYNLASTGGHESDRTLFSYVRGVLGGDGSDGREEIARPGKTITGICATYQDGVETLRLAALLWTEGTSNASEDLKRRWIFSKASDQSFEMWLQQLHEDGARELKRVGRETADLRIFDSKATYLAHIRKFFDVGENAFTLLNRAAGLKQLNSIDEIFRDLVLDDRSAFDRALEVASEFDNLDGIHAELETARRQQESLIPVAKEYEKLLKDQDAVERYQTLKRITPTWFAILGRQKWTQQLEQLASVHVELQSQLEREQEYEVARRSLVETLRERYLQLGGGLIGELEKTIAAQKKLVTEKAENASEYLRMIAKLGLSGELNAETLHRNQVMLVKTQQQVERARSHQWEEMVAASVQEQEQEKRCLDLASTLKKVRERPGSNIPAEFQDFRAELADELALPETDLPFLAELVEVKPDEATWRGAIERAIGAERLRIIVFKKHISRALHWVNHRHNRLHVRLQEAHDTDQPQSFMADGFVRKLNFKDHSFQRTVKNILATRDRHCVSSPDVLRTIEHGLTIEGMMSGRRGTFEKQDQRRLDEGWMTGFDNKDLLENLTAALHTGSRLLQQLKNESQTQREKLTQFDQQLSLIGIILAMEFTKIDLPGAEAELSSSKERLAVLLNPRSDVSQAKIEHDAADAQLKAVESEIRKLDRQIAIVDDQRSKAESEVCKAEVRTGEGLIESESRLAEESHGRFPEVAANDLADAERDTSQRLDRELQAHIERLSDLERRLVRLMEVAKRVDTGALADVGSELEDLHHYLSRLQTLTEEALPEKRKQFLEYLNRSSDQGVTQLLAGIEEEVDAIEQRIRELNQTLVRVDFRSGRYLQLQPQRLEDESLRTLQTAMRKVRSAALRDDDGESHYKALRELVEILRDAGNNRRKVGARALLDPRYRLQFFVVEVDRQTGSRSPRRTGSQSGSGGEKELMASHILTASLSYALCPAGSSRPLYGTVILDEAFSKSSPSAASRIIEALRIFCLHPIFVTPNKEIGLLKQHTRRVICVQRPAKESSLASISWEKLNELADLARQS